MGIKVLSGGAVEAEVLPPEPDVVEVDILPPVLEPHLRSFAPGKGTTFFPAPVVEGMLAECLLECKMALDTVCDVRVKKRDRPKMIRSCYTIFDMYVNNAKERLAPYNAASLNIKHRLCRDILQEMSDRLAANDVTTIKRHTNKKAIQFAKDATEFLTAFHIALREDSQRGERYDAMEDFCGA
tara:strand:+ start:218 stop:766 length:549 start_codon:yes stop_codon:yes gene_type:complete